MSKNKIKKILKKVGLNLVMIHQGLGMFSLRLAVRGQRFRGMINRLRQIEPDISNQEESCRVGFNEYWEFKRRALHCFQCSLMLRALERLKNKEITVVDIGDSAGTHMLYLRQLANPKYTVNSISVNLDMRAIEKIKARGFKAILCRAEDLDLKGNYVDLCTSFQMVEHLHNPALFFRRLAKNAKCNTMIITVPYLKNSRIGLHHTRNNDGNVFFAEDEHIFELSPKDWKLLLLHSGWKVVYNKVFYQYPRRLPILSNLLALYWKKSDFEGFWGAILEKDTRLSDLYQDWEG